MVFVSGVTIIYFFALERVPITGRRRWSWLSKSTLTELHEEESRVMKELRDNEEKIFISSDYPGLRKIEAVFERLVKASGLDGIAWEVRVINEPSMLISPGGTSSLINLLDTLSRDPSLLFPSGLIFILDVANASVFRSGLVLITTGFFHHVIKNDDELAAVLGHGIACVLAQHVLEANYISLFDYRFGLPFVWLSWMTLDAWIRVLCLVPVTVSWSVSFHLSRVRAREADYIGLLLMADAGFDPAGALDLWTKHNEWEEQVRRKKKGILPYLEFRSTHPHVSFSRFFCTG